MEPPRRFEGIFPEIGSKKTFLLFLGCFSATNGSRRVFLNITESIRGEMAILREGSKVAGANA
jgi:hypothetical protein